MFINHDQHCLIYQVEKEDTGLKVIDVMATRMKLSSRLIRAGKRQKTIKLNGYKVSVNAIVDPGDEIAIEIEHLPNTFEANALDFKVIFEDEDIIGVNKPPFLVVHPTKGHPQGTLANGLSYRQNENNEDYKIRFINRLDRDTSGIVLIAKNAFAQQVISEQMKANAVDKIYYALVKGKLPYQKGTMNYPIERESEDSIYRIVRPDGLPSVTHYEVLGESNGYQLVRLKLETGRTHQIRVHLAHEGAPIVGDHLYGTASDKIDRQALHCYKMQFASPRTDEPICLTADLPEDFITLLNETGLSQVDIF